MVSSVIHIVRLGVLGVVTLFSVVNLGIGAHILAVINSSTFNITLDPVNLAVAISVLTILTVVPLLVISLIRKGAVPNYIAIETAWFSILWILWLATGAVTANQVNIPPSCNFAFFVETQSFDCHEPQVLEALAWLNWLILLGYTILTLTLAIIQQSRGNPVWAKSVNEVNLFAPAAPGNYEPKPAAVGYPPQQQPQQQQVYAPQPYQPQPEGYPPVINYTTPPPQQPSPVANYTTTPPQQPSPVANYTTPPPQQPSPVANYTPPPQLPSVPASSLYPQVQG